MYVAKSISDIDGLATRMGALEEEAYNEFAHVFGPRLRAFFIRRGLTETDAEDLAGSCVTDIALKVNKYRQLTEGGFAAWVFTLARRALSDWRRTYRPTEPLSDDFAAPSVEGDGEADLSAVQAVQEALSQFSELDRSLILLRNLREEQTYSSLGKLHGISEGAARVRHFRALKQLRTILEKDPRIKEYLGDARRLGKNHE
jgi:RNA polymerase sigma-70 factor (ECF subfamily)